MSDFGIPTDVSDIIEALLSFIDRYVLPLEEEHKELLENERYRYLENGRFDPRVLELRQQVRMKSSEAGFYTLFGPEELGGGALGAQAAVHIQEALNRHVGPGRTLINDVVISSPFTNGLSPVLLNLDADVRKSYLPGLASGRKTMCFGLSEPNAGSDVYGIKTRAQLDGDSWVINGTKQWITNAPYADYAMLFAVTDTTAKNRRMGGITGFFVDTSTPGLEVTSVIPIMGHLGAEIGILSMQDVRVPADHVLGEVDQGLKVAMGGIGAGRMSMAASCVGMAQWALAKALDYSKQRVTFGRAIAEHQAVQFHLAEMAMDIYAAKNMVTHCAWLVDEGRAPVKEVSMVKAFCTEMLFRVMDRAVQVHGALGLSNELRLEEGLRHARIVRIPDGTGEIQRLTIARRLLAGDTRF